MADREQNNSARWIKRYVNNRLYFIASKTDRNDATEDIAKYVVKHYKRKYDQKS